MTISFDITHRFTGAVQFTAEIDCAEDTPRSVKLGLAVQWGIKTRANLADANLARAKWRDGITITQAPIQIHGLYWPVTILDEHMQIGCELHRLSDWESFDDDRIARMDARQAKKFWAAHKDALLSMARGAGRSVAASEVECVA